jgi:hypothetical protein
MQQFAVGNGCKWHETFRIEWIDARRITRHKRG